MANLFKMHGVQVKLFSGTNGDWLENELNKFLEEYDMNIIDIQLGSNDKSYDVMVVYKAIED